jgi:hypothetical protein
MPDNGLKTPIGRKLNELAMNRAVDAFQIAGQALPCIVVSGNGTFVTVKFDVAQTPFTLPMVRMPVCGSEYFRQPIQTGCRGFAIPADAQLGGVSGLGGGTANLARPSNLGALAFMPIGNTGWPGVPDGMAVVYGPEGVLIKNASGSGSITISTSGRIDIASGGAGIFLDGIRWDTHQHSGVQTGGGETGPPVP